MTWVNDSFDEYKKRPGINASYLKTFINKTPAHAEYERTHPISPTPAMIFGTQVHEHLLLNKPIIVMPEFKGTGSVAEKKKWLAENQNDDSILVDLETKEKLGHIKKQFDDLQILNANTTCEISAYSNYNSYKIRCDIVNFETLTIFDLKTTASANIKNFSRDIFTFGYDIQAAHYLDVASKASSQTFNKFYFVAIENKAPFLPAIFELSEDVLNNARRKIERAIEQHAMCVDSGVFYGYENDAQIIELPKWEQNID